MIITQYTLQNVLKLKFCWGMSDILHHFCYIHVQVLAESISAVPEYRLHDFCYHRTSLLVDEVDYKNLFKSGLN